MAKKKKSKQLQLLKRVKLIERVNFTKHLATMLKAGIPIDEAIETLMDQSENPYLEEILRETLESIKNGQTLSESLSRHEKAFGNFYISLVKISEESGTLERNMEFLADQLNKAYILKKKIQGAMLYPSLIIIAAFIMGAFISVFILPQLTSFFDSFDVELPLTTKILLGISDFMGSYGIFFFGGIILIVIGLIMSMRLPGVKYLWHRVLLKLPVMGKITCLDQLAKFSRNLGVLLKSGVPISKSISVTTDTMSNLKFKEISKRLEKSIEEGKTIHETLEEESYPEIPSIFITMLSVGEKSGTMEDSLLYLGDFYEEEIDTFSNNLTTIIEPFLLIGIGLAVGFIALAIVTPIYELTSSF